MRDSLEPNIVNRFCEEKLASELAAGGFELKSFTVSPYGHAIAEATVQVCARSASLPTAPLERHRRTGG